MNETPPCNDSIEKRPGCIQSALHILGDKWTALILRDLAESPRTFGELESSLDGISPRTLSARLDKLVDENIIVKTIYCQHPPRYQYKLSDKGSELQDVLIKMADWGARYYKPEHASAI